MHSLCEIFFEKHEILSNGGILNKKVLAQQSRFGRQPEPQTLDL